MNTKEQRAKFEVEVIPTNWPNHRSTKLNDKGHYDDAGVENQWRAYQQGWQAAIASQQTDKQTDLIHDLRELVDLTSHQRDVVERAVNALEARQEASQQGQGTKDAALLQAKETMLVIRQVERLELGSMTKIGNAVRAIDSAMNSEKGNVK